MPVKYYCRNCSKRYVEWGAEKLGFRCPDCEDEELVRVGGGEGPSKTTAKPSLRLRTAKAGPVETKATQQLPPVLKGLGNIIESGGGQEVLDNLAEAAPDESVSADNQAAVELADEDVVEEPHELDFEEGGQLLDNEAPRAGGRGPAGPGIAS